MTSIEALKALEEGKKVRKHFWNKEYYLYVGDENKIYNNAGRQFGIAELADYWELFEERTPLSEEEQRIISDTIGAFRGKITKVKKEGSWLDFYGETECVLFSLDYESLDLELLGMENGKEYTLEELDL